MFGETATLLAHEDSTRVSAYFARVYTWMCAALGISAGVAWWTAQSGLLVKMLEKNPGFFGIAILAEVILVVVLTWMLHRMSTALATLMFLAYAALTGFTLSTIFLAYSVASIASVFLMTAAMYGAMAVYGYSTRRNLGGWGGFLFMSLIGMVIASLINLFLRSPMIDWMMTYAGIVVFAGLTAYDHQKLKAYVLAAGDSGHLAIYGALSLYLDFINLFMSLLRAFGNRR